MDRQETNPIALQGKITREALLHAHEFKTTKGNMSVAPQNSKSNETGALYTDIFQPHCKAPYAC